MLHMGGEEKWPRFFYFTTHWDCTKGIYLKHYHMHIFPRYDSDGFAWVEPLDSTIAKGRLKETTAKLVELINQQSLR